MKTLSQLTSNIDPQAESVPTEFRFLDLPRELQDRIMGYVLGSSEVYLEALTGRWGLIDPRCEYWYRSITARLHVPPTPSVLRTAQLEDRMHIRFPHHRYHKIGGSPSQQQAGIQILATCRSIYVDYHAVFYSRNAFHLQPGPIEIASQYFDRLQPKHKQLIKSVVITFTVADLTPEGFQSVDHDVRRAKLFYGQNLRSMNKAQQVSAYIDISMTTLNHLWNRKYQWVRKWQNLERVELRGGKSIRPLKGPMIESTFDGPAWFDFWNSCRRSARSRLTKRYQLCAMKADNFLFPKFLLDVDPVRDWLSTKGPGVRWDPKPWRRRAGNKKPKTDALTPMLDSKISDGM